MVKTPETRHSRQPREPLTLDLSAETVHTAPAAQDEIAEAADTVAASPGTTNHETSMSAREPSPAVETELGDVPTDDAKADDGENTQNG